MSRHIVSVLEDTSLGEVADVLEANELKRVPVIRDGALVGIISRGDLVRALSHMSVESAPGSDDANLQSSMLQQIRKQRWFDSSLVNITVKDSTVQIWGTVDTAEQHRALLVLVIEVAGAAIIDDHVKVGARNTLSGWV